MHRTILIIFPQDYPQTIIAAQILSVDGDGGTITKSMQNYTVTNTVQPKYDKNRSARNLYGKPMRSYAGQITGKDNCTCIEESYYKSWH